VILGLEFTLLAYLVLAALFALLRRRGETPALAFLVVANVLLLWLANPALLLYLALQTLWVLLLYLALRDGRRSPQWAWLAFAGLVPLNLVDLAPNAVAMLEPWQRTAWEGVFWSLGASFFVVKSFVMLREGLSGALRPGWPALASLSFLPSFSAGPICGGLPWAPGHLARGVGARVLKDSFLRVGWGAAALYILAPRLKRLGASLVGTPWGDTADMYLNFVALFLDFSGYTAMALAMAALFGAQLPENFDRPYLATSVREFWRRWHISLSTFIGQYLFKPLVRRTGSRWLGVTLAFMATGLWHEVSWRYLAWGVAHGLAMAASLRHWPAWEALKARMPPPVVTMFCWWLTMSFVASVSYLVLKAPR